MLLALQHGRVGNGLGLRRPPECRIMSRRPRLHPGAGNAVGKERVQELLRSEPTGSHTRSACPVSRFDSDGVQDEAGSSCKSANPN